jgi:hypothetical protein
MIGPVLAWVLLAQTYNISCLSDAEVYIYIYIYI